MPRAVRFDQYGDVDELYVAEVDEPTAGDGEVVVRVVAAAVNPGEIAIREGKLDAMSPATFPSGEGSDFAGRIHALGGGVHGWNVGDEVVGWTDNRNAQADFVVVPSDQLAIKPPDVAWEQAAPLAIAGATAYGAVDAVNPQSGETVLVSGAAGGVGSVVVQLLIQRDVRVLGIAGEGNAEWLRGIGVEPLMYGDGLGFRIREAAPDGVDAVIDTFGGGYVEMAIGLGVPPERIETIIDFEAAGKFGAKQVGGGEIISAAVLSELLDMIAAGQLTIPIAGVFPLERVRRAYTEVAARHTRGKIILDVALD